MFLHQSLVLAILRVAIFSIEVPEAKSITCLRGQPRARNALSFDTEVLKMAPKELPELTTGGGFHFTFFYLLDWISFSLNNGNLCEVKPIQLSARFDVVNCALVKPRVY